MFRVVRRAGLQLQQQRASLYTLPKLPYAYDALEPVISKEIMELHHMKHHQTYVTNLNKLLEGADNDDLPASIAKQAGVKFNGGGHINHSVFWTNLAPPKKGGGQVPTSGPLVDRIKDTFGDVKAFQEKFNAQTAAIQGSGWGWLAYSPQTRALSIVTTPNQDPVASLGLIPLLGVDVWEHAYYLQYKNVRPDYLKAIWGVVNWDNVEERFSDAESKP
ncbi:hypothetical protein PBRA_005113 [Plasmodiophora brassicae]|nr:hypothetical protein PBRA_005113 [Plasmodiophora brassicae]